LKNELVHHYNYQTREEAKADIIKYIELFYNHRRIQKVNRTGFVGESIF
ncbi:IS3 family transposase, partial [Acinetobacter baumannii]